MEEDDAKKAKDEGALAAIWLASEVGRKSVEQALKQRDAAAKKRAHGRRVSREQLNTPVTI